VSAALRRWLPVAAYMALIFYQSAQTSWPVGLHSVWDKLLHVGGYIPLGWLCVRALTDRFRHATTLPVGLGAWAIATVYAASDEWHQSFVPLREMDGGDLFADAIGAALAVVASVVWSRVRTRRAAPSIIEPPKRRAGLSTP